LLFTWNLSPLRSSKLSFEYLLLPPRSALEAVSPRLAPEAASHPHALLLVGASHLLRRHGIGATLERHPFSGLVASAGELLHTP
ncbi:predicted protein, partial [Nematostella vectensis]